MTQAKAEGEFPPALPWHPVSVAQTDGGITSNGLLVPGQEELVQARCSPQPAPASSCTSWSPPCCQQPLQPLRAPHTLCRAGRPCPPAATPPARCLRAALARAHFPVLQHHLAAGGRKAPPAQQHGEVEREGTAVWIAAAGAKQAGQ